MGKRVILAVTNDLTGDQRVHKVAESLRGAGMTPLLVGRKLPGSKPLQRNYSYSRLHLLFRKGPLFYLFFNLRLFLFLLFKKFEIVVANDLDTLPGCWLASRIKRARLVYDSHEYFTEVPELVGRPMVRKIWLQIERRLVPTLSHFYTVNKSIARIYSELYGLRVGVIRNLPPAQRPEPIPGSLPDNFRGFPVILYQGAVNTGRGLEEMVQAMVHLPDCRMIIAGSGDIRGRLTDLIRNLQLEERIFMPGMVPFENLSWYTRQASIGISIEQDIGLNYHFALPNKLFDYMQAGLPVLASGLPEIRAVVEEVGFGKVIERFEPEFLADTIREMLLDKARMAEWSTRAKSAFPKYTWESQEKELLSFFS